MEKEKIGNYEWKCYLIDIIRDSGVGANWINYRFKTQKDLNVTSKIKSVFINKILIISMHVTNIDYSINSSIVARILAYGVTSLWFFTSWHRMSKLRLNSRKFWNLCDRCPSILEESATNAFVSTVVIPRSSEILLNIKHRFCHDLNRNTLGLGQILFDPQLMTERLCSISNMSAVPYNSSLLNIRTLL